MKGGEQPYALSWVPASQSLPWADTGGISVDPYDDIAVWFAHAYADSHTKDGNYAIWVGKVLGSRCAWLKVRLNLVAGPRPLHPGEPVELDLLVENGGDGESASTRAHVALIPDSGEKQRLLSVRVPEIRAGAIVVLRFAPLLPADIQDGAYRLEALVDPNRQDPPIHPRKQ